MVPKLPFGVHTHDPCVLSPVALHQIHDDSPGAVHPGPSRRSPGNRRFGISSFPLCSPMSCHIPQCTDNRCTSTTNSIYTHRIYQKACLVNYFFTILLFGVFLSFTPLRANVSQTLFSAFLRRPDELFGIVLLRIQKNLLCRTTLNHSSVLHHHYRIT